MTGNLTLHTAFHLPPNPEGKQLAVFERLMLDGQFHLSQARFNNATMQGRIEDLSLRGQGKPDEVKTTDPRRSSRKCRATSSWQAVRCNCRTWFMTCRARRFWPTGPMA